MRNERSSENNIPFDALQRVVGKATNSVIKSSDIIPIGQVNEVYDISLENRESVIVRISKRGGDILEHERWALDEARKTGVPTPTTLLIEHISLGQDMIAITVQEKIKGTPLAGLSETEKQQILGKVGAIISKIHEVKTIGYGWTSVEGQGMYASWDQYLTKILSKSDRLLEVADRNKTDQIVIVRALQFIEANRGAYAGDARLVHRDLGPNHFLVEDRRVIGVIDFENCIGGDPVYDLARWDLLYGHEYSTDAVKEGYTNQEIIQNNYDLRMKLYKIHAGLSIIDYLDTQNETELAQSLALQIFNLL